ncbi:uncharacterized protein CPUR_04595 [Claviceps purpurea 20.1]|uniref:Uncharacterized protein n=1 Tax=Claviceps purpurea (strain 20.1) TaxID=1111077 RepID=M1W188_CLAP2|nr:hypothetical protein E4U28_004974 [Claviceps purpurea]KAG6196331.1 hypothetical protein E4U10_001077 [Claviceps purpurea]CCE30746.1 uncharacterized protein CPUR_04595 [Claviceps purpurea 20.1]
MRLMIRNGSRVAPSGDAAANPRRQQLVREGAGALILKECDDSDEMPVDQCFRTVIQAGLAQLVKPALHAAEQQASSNYK